MSEVNRAGGTKAENQSLGFTGISNEFIHPNRCCLLVHPHHRGRTSAAYEMQPAIGATD